MKNHLTSYPVTRICSLLGVSSSGYYAWLKRANKSAKLSEYIQKQYWQHKARLGAPSLLHDVRDTGYLVCNTLKQTLFRRHFPKNVFIHSDQRIQYSCADFKQLLLQYGLRQSMSRRGNCFDNAVVESFFIHSNPILFIVVIMKRGCRLIKHYLNILKSIIIVFVVFQPKARYRRSNMNSNFTKTIK
ncbi:DDE-type integrase/transposase/recombinase [Gilliamella apicola]|uniref:DDE-type integrase/transposase/recombinase n=1 Tax=unclassified Gilliamella TaxID=2685620 RepID=UPI001146FEFE